MLLIEKAFGGRVGGGGGVYILRISSFLLASRLMWS